MSSQGVPQNNRTLVIAKQELRPAQNQQHGQGDSPVRVVVNEVAQPRQ